MNQLTKTLVITALGVVLAVGAGCAAAQKPSAAPQSESNATDAPARGESSSDGASLAQDKCTQCHSFDRVASADKDRAGWETTVDRMVGHGLELTDADRQAIVEYLVSK